MSKGKIGNLKDIRSPFKKVPTFFVITYGENINSLELTTIKNDLGNC
jgi:hypothetical protein